MIQSVSYRQWLSPSMCMTHQVYDKFESFDFVKRTLTSCALVTHVINFSQLSLNGKLCKTNILLKQITIVGHCLSLLLLIDSL